MKEIRSAMKHKHVSLNLDDEDNLGEYFSPQSFWELVPASLTEDERAVITLRLEGHNFKEMAEKLERNRSSVKKIFNSAIKKIRDNNE